MEFLQVLVLIAAQICKSSSKQIELYGEKDCWNNSDHNDLLARMNSDSKYLYHRMIEQVSVELASHTCASHNLNTARILNRYDLKNVGNFGLQLAKTHNIKRLRLSLGTFAVVDVDKESQLEFQSFNFRDGSYSPDEPCTALEIMNGEYYFVSLKCDSSTPVKVVPFCQFKTESECFQSLSDVEKNGPELMEYVFLGKSKDHKFYGSSYQKNWKDAYASCKSEGWTLLDLTHIDSEIIQSKVEAISAYYTSLDLKPWEGICWTSGKYEKPDKIIFSPTKDSFNYTDLPGLIYTKDEILDEFEYCFMIIVSKAGLFRPIICSIHGYYICYEKPKPVDFNDKFEEDWYYALSVENSSQSYLT